MAGFGTWSDDISERWRGGIYYPDYSEVPEPARPRDSDVAVSGSVVSKDFEPKWISSLEFEEDHVEMFRFREGEGWISAGFGLLQLHRHVETHVGVEKYGISLTQFKGAAPIFNKELNRSVSFLPYPIKNAVQITFPGKDGIIAFRKSRPFVPQENPNQDDHGDSDINEEDSDEEMPVESNSNEAPPLPNLTEKATFLSQTALFAWKLIDFLREKTGAKMATRKGVLIAFKGANIRMWRFKPEWKSSDDSGWRDYGDGELEILRIGTSGLLRFVRRGDNSELLTAKITPENAFYFPNMVPLEKSIGPLSVAERFRHHEIELQKAANRPEEIGSDDDELIEDTDDEKTQLAPSTAGLSEGQKITLREYKVSVHMAILKALKLTPAQPKEQTSK